MVDSVVYVANFMSNDVSAFSVAEGGYLAALAGSPFDGVAQPIGVTITPGARYAYVSNAGYLDPSADGVNSVSAFSIGPDGSWSPVHGSPFATDGLVPFMMAVTPDVRYLYAPHIGSDDVAAFSIGADGSLTPVAGSPFPSGGLGPRSAAITRSGRYLYVSNSGPRGLPHDGDDANSVAAFSIEPDGSLRAVPGSPFPADKGARGMAITADDRYLYVANMFGNNVCAFSIGTDGALTQLDSSPYLAGSTTHDLAVTPDGRYLYATNMGTDDISAYSIAADGTLSSVPGSPFSAPTGPHVPAMTHDGRFLYVTTTGSDAVHCFSVGDSGELTEVAPPASSAAGPVGIAVAIFD